MGKARNSALTMDHSTLRHHYTKPHLVFICLVAPDGVQIRQGNKKGSCRHRSLPSAHVIAAWQGRERHRASDPKFFEAVKPNQICKGRNAATFSQNHVN
ncbi:hypothetical protein PSP6_510013 [Paraburkholderia tropica]|nr:hypothetical protein PSP6_510013 [Paraburkholderia tropica]